MENNMPDKFEAEYEIPFVETSPLVWSYTEARTKDGLADWLVANGHPDAGSFYLNFRFLRDVIGASHEMSQEIHKNKEGSMYYLAKVKTKK